MTTSLSTEVASSDVERLARSWWTCWASLHWAFRGHACVLWACHGQITPYEARSVLGANVTYPLNLVIFYREFVATLMPEHELARQIVKATPEPERSHLSRFYAGNNVFTQGRGSMRAINKLIDEVTVPSGMPRLRLTDDGPDSRVATARMVFDGIENSNIVRGGAAPKVPRETPLLLISKDCPKLIATIPSLGFDPKVPEDVISFGNMRDSIWAAVGNAYRDYPSVIASKPIEVLRMEAINRSADPTQQYINLLAFNEETNAGNSRQRKR